MTGGWLLVLASGAIHIAESPHAEPVLHDRKYYVGRSLEACEVIDYACPNGWSGFQEKGGGCGCLPPPKALRKKAKAKKPCARPHAGPGRRSG